MTQPNSMVGCRPRKAPHPYFFGMKNQLYSHILHSFTILKRPISCYRAFRALAAMPTVHLLDYVAGNVRSLVNAINKVGYEVEWVRSPSDFKNAEVST